MQIIGKIDFTEEHKDHNKIKELLASSWLIEELVKLLDKYLMMVKNCFQNNATFERSRQTSFEVFLNKDRESSKTNMGEVLAIYTDSILRKGGMKFPEG